MSKSILHFYLFTILFKRDHLAVKKKYFENIINILFSEHFETIIFVVHIIIGFFLRLLIYIA